MKNKICYASETFGVNALYSTAVESNGLMFFSGMGPTDPATGNVIVGTFEEETIRVFENLKIVLAERKFDFTNVVKTNVYLADIANFSELNRLYAGYFTTQLPTRTTIQAGALPNAIKIEIEMIVATS